MKSLHNFFKKDPKKDSARKDYLNVIKNFPDIDKNEVRIVYEPRGIDIGGLICVDYEIWEGNTIVAKKVDGKKVIKPAVLVGADFFDLTEKERRGVIAHELGHYRHFAKNPTLERIERTNSWEKYFNKIKLNEMGKIPESIFNKHKFNRIRKWHMLGEIYADTAAAEAGYGEGLLSMLKNLYEIDKATDFGSTPTNKKEVEARIENLEKILQI